jgi:uncharacterized protein YprB with RNaseH-like and TPR domain
MLRHTFCHLPGVSARTEQRLWSAGLTTWDEVLGGPVSSRALARRLRLEDLRESVRRHGLREAVWFGDRLDSADAWRLFGDFRGHCAYLDIETTGMHATAVVTTVALYDGRTVRTYVRGVNLDQFARDVQAYPVLVTYNGTSFDLPILRRCLGCRLDQAHIDLRYVLAAVGLRGGLKACERQVGMARPGLEEVDGYVAVLLWHDYQRRKDRRALETLLAYNVQDTVNLEALMVHAHNAHLGQLSEAPFAAGHHLPPPVLPANPFAADAQVLRRVLGQRDRAFQAGEAGRFTAAPARGNEAEG